ITQIIRNVSSKNYSMCLRKD
uniref:Uncharacterized protein n=1 Tax=Tetraodon nigroviridis TaxID=99883 RepID=H3C589_TETNG